MSQTVGVEAGWLARVYETFFLNGVMGVSESPRQLGLPQQSEGRGGAHFCSLEAGWTAG